VKCGCSGRGGIIALLIRNVPLRRAGKRGKGRKKAGRVLHGRRKKEKKDKQFTLDALFRRENGQRRLSSSFWVGKKKAAPSLPITERKEEVGPSGLWFGQTDEPGRASDRLRRKGRTEPRLASAPGRRREKNKRKIAGRFWCINLLSENRVPPPQSEVRKERGEKIGQ